MFKLSECLWNRHGTDAFKRPRHEDLLLAFETYMNFSCVPRSSRVYNQILDTLAFCRVEDPKRYQMQSISELLAYMKSSSNYPWRILIRAQTSQSE